MRLRPPRLPGLLGLPGLLLLAACSGKHADSPDDSAPDTDADSDTDTDTDADSDTDTDTDTDADVLWTGRRFPDTTSRIAILADQLPSGLTAEQQEFAATHFVGTQKQTLSLSEPLRAINPDFLVLHYKLAIWQSAPDVPYITDGESWSNDYDTVSANEDWFWHTESGDRLASTIDGKLVMNLYNADFRAYWKQVLIDQVHAGEYDAVFFDSASPALLQWEAQDPPETRLQGTGARDTAIDEWDGQTYIAVWDDWIADLSAAMDAEGIAVLPNTGAFITSWDTSDYGQTAGIFSEGFASRGWTESDWEASTDELLALAADDKILILQNYLSSTTDVDARMYYLSNYLLVKGRRTYLDAFASSTLEWYPEWELDLGAPSTTGATAADLWDGVAWRRDFEHGAVFVNPSGDTVEDPVGLAGEQVTPDGGGAPGGDGQTSGTIALASVSTLTLPPGTGAVVLWTE